MKCLSYFTVAFYLTSAHALDCQWWQTKVKDHQVSLHSRAGSKVKEHIRSEHCRERWKHADKYAPNLQNDRPKIWPHSEDFKIWSTTERTMLLKVLSGMPPWFELEKASFYRATRSLQKNNPASSAVFGNIIVLYDLFFTASNKQSILVHEFAHYAYSRLNTSEANMFKNLSGWKERYSMNGERIHAPPNKLIKPDSAINAEEDFANHLEIYFSTLSTYRKQHPHLTDFFMKRFPL